LRLTYGPSRACLLAGVLFYGAATSLAQTQTVTRFEHAGRSHTRNTRVSPFAGSVPGKLLPGVMPLSLRDAIDRGLKQNLGALLSNADIRSARGQRWEQLSALLPHVTAAPYVDVSQINLQELGIKFTFPGVNIPPSVRFPILMRA